MLSVVGVYRFHGVLRRLQLFQFGFQFLYCLRVVCADTAHASAAYLVKQALYLVPVLHISVTGGVLLFLFAYREIRAARNEDRGYTGFNGKTAVHVLGKFPGVGVNKAVNLFMVHGVYTLFLVFRNLHGFVYHLPVFCGCAAGLIVVKAVYAICTAGSSLIDCVINGFRFRGCLLRRICLQGKGLPVKTKFLFRGKACLC